MIIDRYKLVAQFGIEDLLDLKKDAILELHEISQREADAYEQFVLAEGRRKYKMAEEIELLRTDGMSMSAAENQSRVKLAKMFGEEYRSDGDTRKLRNYKETLQEIIRDLSQRISISKQSI